MLLGTAAILKAHNGLFSSKKPNLGTAKGASRKLQQPPKPGLGIRKRLLANVNPARLPFERAAGSRVDEHAGPGAGEYVVLGTCLLSTHARVC